MRISSWSSDLELRCRHCHVEWSALWEYCPECQKNFGGAVFPEKQTTQEIAESLRLIEAIQVAFRDVRLEDGTTIHEADLEGIYPADDPERVKARAEDPETHWAEVPEWKLRGVALFFLDDKGWRFYLPAFMTHILRTWRKTGNDFSAVLWSLAPQRGSCTPTKFATLSDEQSRAVYEFVKFFCDYHFDGEVPYAAMDAYWHQFAPGIA